MTVRRTHECALLVACVSILLGFAFDFLFYKHQIGLNFFLFILAILIVALLLNRWVGSKIEISEWGIIILIVFFSGMVFVRSSMLLTLFNVVATVMLCMLLAYIHTGKKLTDYLPNDYCKIFALPIDFIDPFFKTLSELFSMRALFRDHPFAREIIRGCILAVIAAVIFLWLFASADAVFANFFQSLFSFSLGIDFWVQFYLAIIVAVFFTASFSFALKERGRGAAPVAASPHSRLLGQIETAILLGAINVLFLAFIVVQVSYLFGGTVHLMSSGITYAEYATKGFWELIVVALFSYFIISSVEKLVVRDTETHFTSFKVLSGMLCILVVAILISAFSRLNLYEHAYGFTTIRIYSHALMIWIAVMLGLLGFHIVKGTSRQSFALFGFSSAVLFLFCMNVLNPDAFIAQQNLARYKSTGKIDAAYLGSLSTDALPVTIPLLSDERAQDGLEIRDIFRDSLYHTIRGIGNIRWQSANLSKLRAKNLLLPLVTQAHVTDLQQEMFKQ